MSIDLLDRSFRAAVASQRIGAPASVRIVGYGIRNPIRLVPSLRELIGLTERWLGDKAELLHQFGDSRTGEITALARYAGGQSALVSVGVLRQPSHHLEAVLFGTCGTVYWEGDGGSVINIAESSNDDELAIDTTAEPAPEFCRLPSTRLLGKRRVTEGADPPYGVLLVAGDHTHQPGYAAAFAADPRCRLIAVTDHTDVTPRRRELNERLAASLQIPYWDDFDAALNSADVHIVSVCAEPNRRGPLAVRAARAGKHLFLDKPLCGTVREAIEIQEAVKEARVVGHMFSSAHAALAARCREAIESEQLGPIVSAHIDLCFAKGHASGTTEISVRCERSEPDQFELPDAKREMTNIGVYGLVWLQWLFRRRPLAVVASTGNYFFAEHKQRDMEDFGQILLELEGGLVASVTAGRTGWNSHPAGGLQRITLLGTRGSAVFDAARPRAEVWSAAPIWSAPPRNPDDPMGMWVTPPASAYRAQPRQDWFTHPPAEWTDETSFFVDCIEQELDSDVSVDLAAQCTQILAAAYWSAAKGKKVLL